MSTEVIENEVENEAVETVEESQEPKLTILDQRKLDVCVQLDELYPELREAEENVESLKADMKEAKAYLEKIQGQAAQLMRRLYEIEHGGQQHLPFDDEHPDVAAGKDRPHGTPLLDATAKALREDPAKTAKVEVLGMTGSETDKLIEAEIETVAELESRIRNDEWWHKKVKGFGPKKVDKLIDQLTEWRMKNPVPDPDDDEPEEVADEADTIPFGNDLTWWCSECQHEWPVDGDNPQCPECENETGNQKVGYQGCPDANEHGVIVRNFDDVYIVDEETVKLAISVYKVDQMWLSSVYIDDKITPYAFSNDLDLADHGSTSRDAAIWNEISRLEENEDVPDSLRQAATEYVDMHFKDIPGEYLRCVSCENGYIFNSETEKPCCPFCGAVEHTPAD